MTAALLMPAAPAISKPAALPDVQMRVTPTRIRVEGLSKRFVTKRADVQALDMCRLRSSRANSCA